MPYIGAFTEPFPDRVLAAVLYIDQVVDMPDPGRGRSLKQDGLSGPFAQY